MASPAVVTVCAYGGCESNAEGLYTWGLYPDGLHNNRVPLCQKHSSEVWDEIKGCVSAGLVHYVAERNSLELGGES